MTRNERAQIDLLAGRFDDIEPDWEAMYRFLKKQYLLVCDECKETRRQRDMLARRCAEQAQHIAGLLELQAEDAAEAQRHPLADAIAAMQRSGVR